MNVRLPTDLQLVIRVIIYRDFLCIFLFSEDSSYQKTFTYRLNPLFQKETSFQISILEQAFANIEKVEGFKILVDGRLLASKLSSGIKRLELYTPLGISLDSAFNEIFDIVIERISETIFEKLGHSFLSENSIYLDFDIEQIGVLSNLDSFKMKKIISLDYLFYKANGLESFYEMPKADLNIRESKMILSLISEILTKTLSFSSKDLSHISTLIIGGVSYIFFDENDIKEWLLPIFGNKDLEIIFDSNYFAK